MSIVTSAPPAGLAAGAGSGAALGRVELRRWQSGEVSSGSQAVIGESPVALCYNGISHAVMMATPADLEDFALGFSLSEGILGRADQLQGLEIAWHASGVEIDMAIAAEAFAGLKQRRRQLLGVSGCGLCGLDSLAQVLPELAPVAQAVSVSHAALQRALAALSDWQHLQAQTGAAHAAAWCTPAGEICLLREDVGRHNALDKLIGAHARAGHSAEGFVLITSRASYELVLKAARLGWPVLVAVSGPTTMAIECARRTGLTLAGFAREGRHEIYSFAHRIGEQRV